MDTQLLPETTIRYTVDNLGLPDEGWIYTEPAKHPGTICPVSAGMIEAA